MASKSNYYFILENKDISGLKNEYGLPYNDSSYFVSGVFKPDNNLAPEQQEEYFKILNYITKYKQSQYYSHQVLVGDTDGNKDVILPLLENGYYIFNLAGAGYNNETNKSKFVTDKTTPANDNWKKTSLKDELIIKQDFTWSREKQIDNNFYLFWEGTYLYEKNVLLFSLTKSSYGQKGKATIISDKLIKYYGLMFGSTKNSHVDSFNNIIITAFLDNEKTDLMNYYFNSLYKYKDASQTFDKTDIIALGGTGQLINGIINLNKDSYYEVQSQIGKHGATRSSNLRQKDTAPSSSYFSITSNGGPAIESSISIKYFGGAGGNIFQNNFDFYEKTEYVDKYDNQAKAVEDGYLKLEYIGPHNLFFKPITITTDSKIEIDTDTLLTLNSVSQVSDEENRFYIRIPDRVYEIDLEKSTLTGTTGKFEETPLSKLKNLNITELDNDKRIISFKIIPYNDTGYKLNLITKQRDFYFAIAKDSMIESVTINDLEYLDEDNDEDGVNRKHKFHTNDVFEIKVTFKEDNYALLNHLFDVYLSDCVNKNNISSSNNRIQVISSFKMPKHDVLLFLKTEPLYILTVFREDSSVHISEIKVDGVKNTIENLPFIKKYYYDDYIDIITSFKSGDSKRLFAILDNDYMDSQFTNFYIYQRGNDNQMGTILSYPGKAGGFTDIQTQEMDFYMPDHDLTVYIKETTILRTIKIYRDPYQDFSQEERIFEVIVKGQKGVIWQGALPDYKTPRKSSDGKVGIGFKVSQDIVYGEIVDLYMKFDNVRMKLDESHFYGQIIPQIIYKPGESINVSISGDINLWQRVTFLMPMTDFTLYLKWIERFYLFQIDYIVSLIKSATLSLTRDGKVKSYNINNDFKFYLYDKIKFNIRATTPFLLSSTADISKIYYLIDEEKLESQKKFVTDGLKFTFTASGGGATIALPPPNGYQIKNNIFVFLDFYFPVGAGLKVINYSQGEIPLTPGTYEITLVGATGGRCPSDGYYWGSGGSFNINVQEITILSYYIGQNGEDGEDVTKGPGGGGGGGSSMLIFDSKVNGFDAIWCDGGYGGGGGEHFIGVLGIGASYSGGDGGDGGNWDNNGNGTDGSQGDSGGTDFNGRGGFGGTGGLGYNRNEFLTGLAVKTYQLDECPEEIGDEIDEAEGNGGYFKIKRLN